MKKRVHYSPIIIVWLFLFSLSLFAAETETIDMPRCHQCYFTFEHEHDGAWIKKYASFDSAREKIKYVTRESYILFRITDSVLEVNYHDLFVREGDWKSVVWRNCIGTRYTPLHVSLNEKMLYRIIHTLAESKVYINDNAWTMEWAMGNWQVFDNNVGPWQWVYLRKFKDIYPAIDKIVFNLYPKENSFSYKRTLTPDDPIQHPLVLGGIEPAREVDDILSEIRDSGIDVEFQDI